MSTISNSLIHQLANDTNYYSCCTSFYESDFVKFLLDNTLHPGGLRLTEELGNLLKIKPTDTLVDLACGTGVSLILLNSEPNNFSIGVDFAFNNLLGAQDVKIKYDLSSIEFINGDAQHPPLRSSSTSKVMLECSFCIFPEKQQAVSAIHRILVEDGSFGISDVVVQKDLDFLKTKMISRIACVSDAKSLNEYLEYFETNGFKVDCVLDRREVILELHKSLKKKVLALNITKSMIKLKEWNFDLGEINFKEINGYVDKIREFVDMEIGSYVVITGSK